MLIRNVYYGEQPDNVIVTERGGKAVIEFPTNVSEIETEDGVQYKAEIVYYIETSATPNLKARVEAEFDAWLELAKVPVSQPATLNDVVEALNALTEFVIGGE